MSLKTLKPPSYEGQRQKSHYHKPDSVEELTQRNIETIAQIDNAAQAQRSGPDRAADAIAAFCGSMAFVWVHILWFSAWMVWNTVPLIPKGWHFDIFPFGFLTLVVSLEAIFLSTFILISQNRQGRVAERRNHLDLQINLLSEQENTKMLSILASIQKHLGIEDSDPEVGVLEESTRPDEMVKQIEEIIEKNEREHRNQNRNGAL